MLIFRPAIYDLWSFFTGYFCLIGCFFQMYMVRFRWVRRELGNYNGFHSVGKLLWLIIVWGDSVICISKKLSLFFFFISLNISLPLHFLLVKSRYHYSTIILAIGGTVYFNRSFVLYYKEIKFIFIIKGLDQFNNF